MSTPIEIAGTVLAKASLLDHRINPTKETIQAWAECFAGEDIWPREALDGVAAHYRKPNPFPLMPGDVLAYCGELPVWSSNEHASQFLGEWIEHPFADVIPTFTGIPWPEVSIPDDVPPTQEQFWLGESRRRWIRENRQRLIGAILSTRHHSRELGR